MAEIISTIDELENIYKRYEKVIIYGAGIVGSLLVQYMLKNDYNSRLFCIAVKSKQNNPDNILGVPVCELKVLEEYRENSLFIIGTYENLQEEILKDLEKFGCREVRCMSNLLCAVLRKKMLIFQQKSLICYRQKEDKLEDYMRK